MTLTDAMHTLADDMYEQLPADELLHLFTGAAVASIPGANLAGITLATRGDAVETVAATDPRVQQIDDHQYAVREGPCLDALWQDPTVHMPDRAREQRWTAFTEALAAFEVNSMLCLRLFAAGDRLGALNLYSHDVNAFDGEAEQLGQLFAAQAAVALASARKIDQLQQAISSRDVIGQAKGIVMERYRIDAAAAFTMLVRLSQSMHTKLVQIAEQVVASVPTSPTG